MKRLLTGCLLLTLWAGSPQPSRADSFRTSITEDGHSMTVAIDGFVNDHPVHFTKTADISGKLAIQKELVIYQAFKEIGATPPLHMMSGLILTGLGLFAAFVTAALLFLRRKRMRLV